MLDTIKTTDHLSVVEREELVLLFAKILENCPSITAKLGDIKPGTPEFAQILEEGARSIAPFIYHVNP
jgi:hypothetical protein